MNSKNIKSVRSNILSWYQTNKRDFLWRHNPTPYKIMIAEFMLQRTRAEQVEPVYKKFLKEYPGVMALSKAKIARIRKVTDNLGLHKRASNFVDAAKYIVKYYGGKYPDNAKELLQIPGIGSYVAGAILTVCFNKKHPVIDSNIARFINRCFNLKLEGEIRRKKDIINFAEMLFKTNNPGKLLFAVLDFTALICKPLSRECNICKLKTICK